MNILLTSVGRRAYMVKFFQTALAGQGEVHVCNSDANTVAFLYADHHIISPMIYDPDYIPFLLSYCQDQRIDAIISLFDIDLLVLAQHREHFAQIGVRVIVSDPALIAICNDKWKTYHYLLQNGFHTPKTYLTLEDTLDALTQGDISYPVVVKPRFGCGSISVSIAENEDDLRWCYTRNLDRINKTYLKYESNSVEQKIVLQECLHGQEFGADIINDLNGNFCNAIIRKKLAMRSGETDIARIVDHPEICDTLQRLGKCTRHIANMDCDIFLVNGIPYILELNARFGGGYPFSHMAGCDLPGAIVHWLDGKPVSEQMLTAEIGYLGFKELVITGGT